MHTTQFAIRDVGLYRPVLELAAETAANWTKRPLAMVAGLAGPTKQATAEARTARDIGYHAGLLSLAAMKSASEDEIIAHCTAVAAEIPLVGFYLQPAVGGVILSSRFWQRFASIDNVIAIKIAPFNRYRTLDVLRGVAAAGALDRVALYTGNDDHILLDLMLPFDLRDKGVTTRTYFKGGLLGHWSVWTASAIKQFERCKAARHKDSVPGRSARARCPRHRLQQRLLRRRQQFSRLHRRLSRGAAAPGPDAGPVVPRSERGPQPRPEGRDRPRLLASMPTSATTPSSRTI